MGFQFKALEAGSFRHLFSMDDAQLQDMQAIRLTVDECPGTPCRVSLEDTPIGEEVIALNYTHQPANSPFRASHAIYVRKDVKTAYPAANEIPELLRHRLLSLRGFNSEGMIIEAEAVEGTIVENEIERMFGNDEVIEIHVHFAKPGCFAASVHRC